MQSSKSNFLKTYGVFIFFIGVFVFLYFLNAIFPTQSDDMGAGFGGLTAAINSYNNWNGRFGELLRVSFGSYLATTPFYAPINALVGTAVIFLIFLITFARKPEVSLKDFSILLILIVFLLFDESFCFGAVFYWAAGSFNHLWAWLLILLWVLPYRFYWHRIITNKINYIETNKILKTIFLLFIGFLAGWSTEFGVVFIFLQFCLILYAYVVHKQHLPMWYFIGIISMTAGWLFLYTCPGIQKRILALLSYGEEYLSISEIIRMPFKLFIKTIIHTYERKTRWLYYENYALLTSFLLVSSIFDVPSLKKTVRAFAIIIFIGIILKYLPRSVFLISAICVALLYAYILRHKNNNAARMFFIIGCVLFAEFIFIGATIQVYYMPRRAGFQYSILNFILIAIVMDYCFEAFKSNFKVKLSAFTFCALLNLSIISFVSWECYSMYLKWREMEQSIELQKRNGIRDVIVDKATFESKYWSYGEWSNPDENFNEWPNTSYARVYGVDTFTAK